MGTLQQEREELILKLQKLDEQNRAEGGLSVATSDVSQKDWKGKVLAAMRAVDPESAADPKLAIWFDVDKFGGRRQQRALMVRRFINGDFFTGKGLLPHQKLDDMPAVEQAVKDAVAELTKLSTESFARGNALSQAQRSAAEERMARKKLEAEFQAEREATRQRLEELTALIAAQSSVMAPDISATVTPGAGAPEAPSEVPPPSSAPPASTAPDATSDASPEPSDSLANALTTELKVAPSLEEALAAERKPSVKAPPKKKRGGK